MVDFDTVEITIMETAETYHSSVILTGSSHGKGEHIKLFHNNNRFHLRWAFFMT